MCRLRRILITCLKHFLCPVCIIYIRSATDLEDWLIWMIISYIGLVSSIQIRIIRGCHVASASPVLVAYSEIINLPCLLMTILFTKLCHRGYSIKSHIFHPFGHFLNSAASYIAIDICLTSDLLTQFKKFMCSEAVIFCNTAPMCVDHLLSGFLWSDTILPVIFVCKASTRPAKNRQLHFPQSCYDIISHSICIWNIRVLSYIKSLIDTSSQMF